MIRFFGGVFFLMGWLAGTTVLGQESLDSLWGAYRQASTREAQLEIQARIAYLYSEGKPDSSLLLGQQVIQESEALKLNPPLLLALHAVGFAAIMKGQYTEAGAFFERGYALSKAIADVASQVRFLNNLGILYEYMSNYPRAIQYYQEAYRLQATIDPDDVVEMLSNIGNVYSQQGDSTKALNYYLQALEKAEKDRAFHYPTIGIIYSNLGVHYAYTQQDSLARLYIDKSLSITATIGDPNTDAVTYFGLAKSYLNTRELDQAKQAAQQSIQLFEETEDPVGRLSPLLILADVQRLEGAYQESIQLAREALDFATEVSAGELVSESHQALYQTYKAMRQTDQALFHFEQYTAIRDSIFNIQKTNIIDQIETTTALALKDIELEKERQQRIFQQRATYLTGAFLVVSLFFIGIIIRNRKKINKAYQKLKFANAEILQQKEEILQTLQMISEQKNIIEGKNKNIIDSINYAKRIQSAILPSASVIADTLPQSFLLNLPKDIVSGDFYWFSNRSLPAHTCFLAIADCTGHGVPGALMTVIGHNLLQQIIEQDHIHQPAQVLTQLDQRLLQTFRQQGLDTDKIQDGMDILLLHIDTQSRAITFAGAKRPLWVFDQDQELTVYKGDKFPIGSRQYKQKTFTQQRLTLPEGSMIYAFSDGYPDQFGTDGKMTLKRFRTHLQSLVHQPPAVQRDELSRYFKDWKGQLPQTDDVLLFGMRL
ncbi:MAG: tetratricopeptide repeat protein [Bernardetiaceae bacterium]